MKTFVWILLSLVVFASSIWLGMQIASAGIRQFSETGYLNHNGILVYEEPGSPALTVSLEFDDKSYCRFGSERLPCLTALRPIDGAYSNRRVSVSGITFTPGRVLVRELSAD